MPQVITLADGPHNLEAPKGSVLVALQRAGYPLSKQFSGAVLLTGETADEADWNLGAICDHIAAVMRDPEWDAERVADNIVIDEIADYYSALVELANESFGGEPDPKASSADSPK